MTSSRPRPRSHQEARRQQQKRLRPLDSDQLARVTGGDDQANLPVFSEIRVVGHTVAADDGYRFYFDGYWYSDPVWK